MLNRVKLCTPYGGSSFKLVCAYERLATVNFFQPNSVEDEAAARPRPRPDPPSSTRIAYILSIIKFRSMLPATSYKLLQSSGRWGPWLFGPCKAIRIEPCQTNCTELVIPCKVLLITASFGRFRDCSSDELLHFLSLIKSDAYMLYATTKITL